MLEYLRALAPFSVIERGNALVQAGSVTDCSKAGSKIIGGVRGDSDQSLSVTLQVLSPAKITASCDCSSQSEMDEQWCQHAVALILRAAELEFFKHGEGFASSEAMYRLNTSSAQEIAKVLGEVGKATPQAVTTAQAPEVSILLECSTDRLGVRVLFDGATQEPAVFEVFEQRSSRALDVILLKMLDDLGSWDDAAQLWYISSSDSIATIIGLIEEYDSVSLLGSSAPAHFAREYLEAKLTVEWNEASVGLSMEWLLPDGGHLPKESEILGTGPYWTLVNSTLYMLSTTASRIGSLFPYSPTLALPRPQVGPLLEVLDDAQGSPYVTILNPELKPQAETKPPTISIELSRSDDSAAHFSSDLDLQIQATIEFTYPTPSSKRNVVYLPDREAERAAFELLRGLGFATTGERGTFLLKGDGALDLIHGGRKLFPDDWEIRGADAIKRGVRFAELKLNIGVSSPSQRGRTSKGINWFDCKIALTQNNANVPISVLFKTPSRGSDRWVRLDNGSYAMVPGGGLKALKNTLGTVDPSFRLTNTIKAQLSSAQAIGLTGQAAYQVSLSLDDRLKAILKKLKDFDQIESLKVSSGFHGKLRPYQLDGLSWLNFLDDFNLGGILADEMGLGKTVQTLAFLDHLKRKRKKSRAAHRPSLVIAPTSVIMNWSYEAQRFVPEHKVLLLHGSRRKESFKEIPNCDLVVTSYALLRLDRLDLQQHEFEYVILDEAQLIKNAQTSTARAAKSLHAERRFALTGTPTENRPLELWSIFDFLMPGYLGSKEFFKGQIERPLIDAAIANTPDVEVAGLLRAKTKPFILRRLKADVERDLPPKVETTLHVEMTPSQARLYNQIVAEVRPKVFEAVAERGVRGASISILAALLRLRQVCNHPNSIEALRDAPGYDSGKFKTLKEITLQAVESGRKILLFSQFKDMLGIIRTFLNEERIEHLYLDGSTKDRQPLIDQFNSDEKVRLFLISLKAGGLGLNLTAADTVILYDPWWNPAVENQAIDRAHRIGQRKKVSVYRLVTEDSVEQKIMDLKARKARLVEALVDENGMGSISLTKGELEGLFAPLPDVE